MRKTRILNNPLKQRQHDEIDQNFDSAGVSGAIHFWRRDRKLWYEGTKYLQQDTHFNLFNSPMLTTNLDRYQLITDEISPMKLENPRKYTMQGDTKQSFFKDKFANIKDKRSMTSTMIAEKPNCPMKPYGERGAMNTQQHKQIRGVSATQTCYNTFYENPKEQEKKANTMRPDFYQSVVPKYLNIGYNSMAQNFEQENYLHKKPAIIRPREYSADGNFRKSQLLTSTKWRSGLTAKKYI